MKKPSCFTDQQWKDWQKDKRLAQGGDKSETHPCSKTQCPPNSDWRKKMRIEGKCDKFTELVNNSKGIVPIVPVTDEPEAEETPHVTSPDAPQATQMPKKYPRTGKRLVARILKDSREKDKTHQSRWKHWAKLNPRLVDQIRRKVAERNLLLEYIRKRLSTEALSKEYGVTKRNINDVSQRHIWKD